MKKVLLTILFWIGSLTWGLPLTIVGLGVAIALLATGHKPYKFGPAIYFTALDGAGFEMGPFFLAPKEGGSFYLCSHELGHGWQNLILGPFMIFAVTIPSASRFWVREIKERFDKLKFIIILSCIGAMMGAALIVVGILTNFVWLCVVGAIVIGYFICLGFWLKTSELRKEDLKQKNDYNDFYVEADASYRGENFMKKYFPDEVK